MMLKTFWKTVEHNQEDFDEFSEVDELYSTLSLDKVESLEDLVPIVPPGLVKADMRNAKLAAEIAKELRRFHQVEISASAVEFDDSEKLKMYKTISFSEVHNEIIVLKELPSLFNAPVVFSHNDLLSEKTMTYNFFLLQRVYY